jgi:hypothetical protein
MAGTSNRKQSSKRKAKRDEQIGKFEPNQTELQVPRRGYTKEWMKGVER